MHARGKRYEERDEYHFDAHFITSGFLEFVQIVVLID
jgi:hypothetical protein